jgi:hypothetical protein
MRLYVSAQLFSNCSEFLAKAPGLQGYFTKLKKLRGPGELARGNGRFAYFARFRGKQDQ